MSRILLNKKYLSKPSRYPRFRPGFIPPLAQALLVFSAFGILILVLLTQCRGKLDISPSVFFSQELPDFASIENTSEKKTAFFNYLLPFVAEANQELLQEREHLLMLIKDHDSTDELSAKELLWVRRQLEDHFPNEEITGFSMADLQRLVPHVDIIPPSLALAQAAVESGWGTSRFARQGNNLFGMWCYEPGCGMVPRRRPAGETYEVESYKTPKDSFYDYMENLNSNSAYQPLRSIRSDLRAGGDPITGISLANGLVRYSQEGWTYVKKIQSMIRANNLSQYDNL